MDVELCDNWWFVWGMEWDVLFIYFYGIEFGSYWFIWFVYIFEVNLVELSFIVVFVVLDVEMLMFGFYVVDLKFLNLECCYVIV